MRFLESRINYEQSAVASHRTPEFKLGRMRRLLKQLGDPHDALRVVHVAGTKGKGSTATYVASILQAAGYRTGLYTSPHLETPEERFRIDGGMIPPERFADLVLRLRDVAAGLDAQPDDPLGGPTYFELVTAVAFAYFAEAAVDYAVLEVGMGGRLDSTNVCLPQVCAITSISRDHQRQLGDTLAEIAREKAGIIKRGVPVVSGVRTPEAAAVIQAVCDRQAAPLLAIEHDFRPEAGNSAGFRFTASEAAGGCIDALSPGMPGAAQIDNAAIAVAIAMQLRLRGAAISDDAIRSGVASARCAGRLETVLGEPAIVLDVAHNDASARELADYLRNQFPDRPLTMVLAISRDKKLDDVLRPLAPLAQRVIATKYLGNPRWTPPEEIAARWASLSGLPPTICSELNDACETAMAETPTNGVICFTGSFFLIGEARACLRRRGVVLPQDIAAIAPGEASLTSSAT